MFSSNHQLWNVELRASSRASDPICARRFAKDVFAQVDNQFGWILLASQAHTHTHSCAASMASIDRALYARHNPLELCSDDHFAPLSVPLRPANLARLPLRFLLVGSGFLLGNLLYNLLTTGTPTAALWASVEGSLSWTVSSPVFPPTSSVSISRPSLFLSLSLSLCLPLSVFLYLCIYISPSLSRSVSLSL